MKPISVQVDELLTGRNPSADNRLAADLGVRIKPEEQDEVPPVVLGNAGYETDASGKAIEVPRNEHEATLLSIGFVRGIEAVRGVLRKNGVELPIDTLLDVMNLTLCSRELSQKKL